MWWQPVNSGLDMDQFAIDELLVSAYSDLRSVNDDFDGKPVTVDLFCLTLASKLTAWLFLVSYDTA